MGVPHFGHITCMQGCPAACGTFSPQLGQTQEPPGPAVRGPPILPAPWPLPCRRPPPPRPAPIPKPIGITFSPSCRHHRWQPGIANTRLASSPFRYAASTASTMPQVKPITCTPAAFNLASRGAEIAPQMRTSLSNRKNSAMRVSASVAGKRLSSRLISLPPSTSINRKLAATSNTGEMRPCHCGIAILITEGCCKIRANVQLAAARDSCPPLKAK